MNSDFVREFLVFVAEQDIHGEVFWNKELSFYIACDDCFVWGASDLEEVTADTLNLLRQALKDADEVWGPLLYCARRRGMRPQGAIYSEIDPEFWPLFDACGPARITGLGNPRPQPR